MDKLQRLREMLKVRETAIDKMKAEFAQSQPAVKAAEQVIEADRLLYQSIEEKVDEATKLFDLILKYGVI